MTQLIEESMKKKQQHIDMHTLYVGMEWKGRLKGIIEETGKIGDRGTLRNLSNSTRLSGNGKMCACEFVFAFLYLGW